MSCESKSASFIRRGGSGSMVLRLNDLVVLERKFAWQRGTCRARVRTMPRSVSGKSEYRFWRQTRVKTKGQSLSGDSVSGRQTPDSNLKCNTRGKQGMGCCDGQTIQAPQRQARGVILAEHRRGASLRVIGLLLGRSATMIGRELRRGGLVRAAGERCEVTADPT